MIDPNEICFVMEATGLDWVTASAAIEAIRQYDADQYLAGLELMELRQRVAAE